MVFPPIIHTFSPVKEMRVAIYSGAIPSTTFIENLIKGIADEGIEVCLFGTRNKLTNYASHHIHIYATPKNGVLLLFSVVAQFIALCISHPKRLKVLFAHLRKQKTKTSLRAWGKMLPIMLHLPDVFHLQWAKSAEEWLFLKKLGVKLVVSFRGAQVNYSPVCDDALAASYRRSLPQYDVYHCVSNAIMKEGVKYGAVEEKSTVIYPAVQDKLLERQLTRTSSKVLRILSVGRDHWKKGYRVSLDAMAILKERGVPFHYTIVAGGEKEELIYAISDLNLTDEVTLIDNLPHDKVFEQHANADIFLLPSFEEGVANVVLEAMALGTPVISTDCGGMKEVIEDGVNGFIVPMRNPKAAAEAIVRFSKLDEEQKQHLVEKAKETIKQKHVLRIQVSQMLKLYERVCHE